MNIKIKAVATAVCVLLLLTVAAGYVASTANTTTVEQMHNFANRTAAKWIAMNKNAGGQYTPGQLAATLGTDSATILNIMVEDTHYIKKEFQDAYSAAKFSNITRSVHIHNGKDDTIYLVAGYPVAGFEVENTGTFATFFDGLPLSLVSQLEKDLDGTMSEKSANDEGKVRYFQQENGLYLVGLYITPGSTTTSG